MTAPSGCSDDRRPTAVPDPDAVPDVDVLVVDNYDSFAYNLVQYVGELAGEVTVRRNDAIDLAAVRALDPDGVVVSPGPGRPEDAGVSTALFEAADLPVLGVCLGHQALCAAHGAPVEQAPAVLHGKPSVIEHDGAGIYRSLPERLRVGRYHSLLVRREALPESLVETAWTVPDERTSADVDDDDGDGQPTARDEVSDGQSTTSDEDTGNEDDGDEQSVLMGVRHRERPHYGVQFHPESILTGAEDESGSDATDASLGVGKRLLANFCELAAEHCQCAAGTSQHAGERRQRDERGTDDAPGGGGG